MSAPSSVSFGDNVRISQAPEAEARNVAGLCGVVYGETTPSLTGVEVIGNMDSDYAVNVHFDSLDTSYWFAPSLVEFIDHGAGQEIRLDGVARKWVRSASGEWVEHGPRKPWWKFW